MSDFLARIKPRKSSQTGEVPLISELQVGELAINTADGKIFTKHTNNTIVEMVGSGSGGGGTGGGGASTVEELTNVVARQGYPPFAQLPQWTWEFPNGYPTTIQEFDQRVNEPGAWFYSNEFEGQADPLFYVAAPANGIAVDPFWDELGETGRIWVAWTPNFFGSQEELEAYDFQFYEANYTNLTQRANGSWAFQIPQAILDIFLNQGREGLGIENDLLNYGTFWVRTTDPLIDVNANQGDIIYAGGDGNWYVQTLKTTSVADLPAQQTLEQESELTFQYADKLEENKLLVYEPSNNLYALKYPDKLYESTGSWSGRKYNDLDFGLGEQFAVNEAENEGYDPAKIFNPLTDSHDGNEDFYGIAIPEELRSLKFWGKNPPRHLFVNLRKKAGIWWDRRNDLSVPQVGDSYPLPNLNHFEGEYGQSYRDFRYTANGVEFYLAIEEVPCHCTQIAWSSYITETGIPALKIRADYQWGDIGQGACPSPGETGYNFCGFSFVAEFRGSQDFAPDGTNTNGVIFASYGRIWPGAQNYTLSVYPSGPGSTNPDVEYQEHYRGLIVGGNDVIHRQGFSDNDNQDGGMQARWTDFNFSNDYDGLGLSGLGDVEEAGVLADGDALVWDANTEIFRYRQLRTPDIIDSENVPDGYVLSKGSQTTTTPGGEPVVKPTGEWKKLNEISDFDDVPEPPTAGRNLLTYIQGSGEWKQITEIESVGSVNGKIGDVQLETSDLTDVGVSYQIDAGSWTLTADSAGASEAYFDSVDGRFVINVTDADGSSFNNAAVYLQSSAPETVFFKSESGQILYSGIVNGPVDLFRGVFNLYPADTAWTSSLVVGERLVIEVERKDLGALTKQPGDILVWDGTAYKPVPSSGIPGGGGGADPALEARVDALETEVQSLQQQLADSVEEAPQNGQAYVRQDGQWLTLTSVLDALGYVPGGGPTPDPEIPEVVNGGNFTTGEAGSVDITVSGGNFTTGQAGSSDELVDGGDFSSDVTIPETVSGGDFTTGSGGSADVTVSGGDFTTGEAGSVDETVDGGVFTGGGEITAGGGDFTTGGSGGPDVTYGGGDFTTGSSSGQDITLDGGDFGGPVSSGGDFSTGESGDDDTTYGAGDFTSGTASGQDITLDGGDFSS